MTRSKLIQIVVSLVTIAMLLVACAQQTATPAAQQPAATKAPAATEAPAPAAEKNCNNDPQTCEYLKGKDFTGQTLVVGVWGGTIEEVQRDMIIPVLESYGAKVELLLGGTSDRLTKIYAEKDNPTMHIAFLNIYESRQAMKDGVTEEPSAKIPAFNDLYPLAQIGGYGMSFMGLGIAYCLDAFPNGAPKWADLWDPSHKGKIALPNYPGSEGDGFLAMAARVHGQDETNPDFAFEKLAELKPFVMSYNALDEVMPLIESCEVHAAPMISGYAWDYIDKGLKFGFSWPADGIVQMMDTLTIVKNNPNPELADAYTQVALSVPVQQAYAERIFFGPTNSKVKLTGEAADKTVYGDKAEKLVGLNWEFIIKERVPNTEKWNRLLLED